MAVRIRSLAVAGPLYVPLTSGRSVRLSPGGSSGDLDDVEIAGNAKIDRLRDRGLIEVEQASADQPGERADQPGEKAEEDQAEEKKQASRRTARDQN